MTDPSHVPAVTFERPLRTAEVPPEGLEINLVANAAERDSLARLNALVAIPALAAQLRVRRWRGDGLEVEGEVRATVRQTCVLTLDEFDAEIVAPAYMRFAPPRDPAPTRRPRNTRTADVADDGALTVGLEDDPPDPLVGGGIDLGAIVSEFLTLALDPYPRKPGAQFTEPNPDDDGAEMSPFVVLRSKADKPSKA
jgi:hypothetical protein